MINWQDIYTELPNWLPSMNFTWNQQRNRWESPYNIDGSEPENKREDKTYTYLNESNITLKENGNNGHIRLVDWLCTYGSYSEPKEVFKDFYENAPNHELYIPKQIIQTPKTAPNIPSGRKLVKNYIKGIQGIALEYFYSRGIFDIANSDIIQNIGTGTALLPRGNDNYYWQNNTIILRSRTTEGEKDALSYVNATSVLKNGRYNNLKKDGSKKRYKGFFKGQSPTKGGAVRTAEPRLGILGVCEGIEDALSIMQMNGYFREQAGLFDKCREHYGNHLPESFPVWATLGIEGLKSFIAPEDIDTLYILPDRDPQEDYSYLNNMIYNHRKKGITVIPILPPENRKDWNEHLMKYIESLDEKKEQ